MELSWVHTKLSQQQVVGEDTDHGWTSDDEDTDHGWTSDGEDTDHGWASVGEDIDHGWTSDGVLTDRNQERQFGMHPLSLSINIILFII